MKVAGWLCIFMGVILILCAARWMIHVEGEEIRAGEAAYSTLASLKATIDENNMSSDAFQGGGAQEALPQEESMSVLEINGYAYIGYLTVPELALELPVQADWSTDGLENSPCRYVGSLATHDMIIAGHNYRSHFSPLKQLTVGSRVIFTDVTENRYTYTVSEILTVKGDDVKMMLSNSDQWDLTLFTCTYGGKSRLTFRCVFEN